MKNVIERYFDLFNKGDAEGMLSLVDEHIVHEINQGKVQKGKATFREFLNHMNECYKEHLDNIVVMDSGNGVNYSAEFIVNGIYLKTDGSLPEARNQKYSIRAGSFFEVRGGKITRVSTYYNLPLWIELVK